MIVDTSLTKAIASATVFLAVAIAGSSCSTNDEAALEPVLSIEQLNTMADEARLAELQFGVAQDILAGQCMRAQGFEYEQTATTKIQVERSDASSAAERKRQEFDEWEPGLYGYANPDLGAVTETEPVDPDDPAFNQTSAYDEAWSIAMFGPTEGTDQFEVDFGHAGVAASKEGCLGEATMQLGGQKAFEVSVLGSGFALLSSQIGKRAESDVRLIEATEDWSRCMAEQGIQASDGSVFANPEQAKGDLQRQSETNKATTEEIRVATADRDCQLSTGYIEVLIEVTDDAQLTVLSEPEVEALVTRWLEIGDEPFREINQVLAENNIES